MDEMMNRTLLAFFFSISPCPLSLACLGLPARADTVALSLSLVRYSPFNRHRVHLPMFPLCRPIE